MTFEQIISDLKNKIYKPIYFLMGDEPYYIDVITTFITQNVLSESEKTLNQIILYGKDVTIPSIIDTAKRFPMMANHQVVILKEAQDIKNFDKFIFYAENPLKSTILVINYKYRKLDIKRKLFKVLEKNGVVFESKKLYDDKIPNWINNYLKKQNCTMEPEAGMLLTEFLGNDLSKIANELDKLIITLPVNNKKITAKHIEKNIGISKDYNNFELHKALTQKNILKANRIINYFSQNQKNNPISWTISSLYYYFSKILAYHFIKDKTKQNVASILKVNFYFVGDYEKAARAFSSKKVMEIISILREYDLKSKGIGNVSTPPGELLKELIFKILH